MSGAYPPSKIVAPPQPGGAPSALYRPPARSATPPRNLRREKGERGWAMRTDPFEKALLFELRPRRDFRDHLPLPPRRVAEAPGAGGTAGWRRRLPPKPEQPRDRSRRSREPAPKGIR